MSRRSRNSTDADDTIIASPATNIACSSISTGASRIVHDIVNLFMAVNASMAASMIGSAARKRSEEHTSELQSQSNLVCRRLLENKNLAHNLENLLLL